MGAADSKPSAGPTHTWKSETPVRFSQDMVDSLQGSNENDSTRSKTLELHIQARVQEELKRLAARTDQTFKDVAEKLSSEDSPSTSQPEGDKLRNLGRESVQKEVEELRKKLEGRKHVKSIEEFDSGVEKTRSELVKCLRGNDRRPLDCYEEVQAFKDEVGRFQKEWVDKAIQ